MPRIVSDTKLVFNAHECIIDLLFVPGKNQLLSRSIDDHIILWDISSFQATKVMTFPVVPGIMNIAISPDGEKLAICGWNHLEIWNINIKKIEYSKKYENAMGWGLIRSGYFTSDGKKFLLGLHGGNVRLFETKTLNQKDIDLNLITKEREEQLSKLGYPYLEEMIPGTMPQDVYTQYSDGSISIWNINDMKEHSLCKLPIVPFQIFEETKQIVQGSVWLGQFVDHSKLLMKSFGIEPTRDREDFLRISQIPSGNLIKTLPNCRGIIQNKIGEAHLFCGDTSGGVKGYETIHWEEVLTIPSDTTLGPAIIAVMDSPGGRIAYGTAKGCICVRSFIN